VGTGPEGHLNCAFRVPSSQQDAEKVALLTRPAPVAASPARPEAARTASLPRDAPFSTRRSRFAQRLNKRDTITPQTVHS
jgi:hypothetical protein